MPPTVDRIAINVSQGKRKEQVVILAGINILTDMGPGIKVFGSNGVEILLREEISNTIQTTCQDCSDIQSTGKEQSLTIGGCGNANDIGTNDEAGPPENAGQLSLVDDNAGGTGWRVNIIKENITATGRANGAGINGKDMTYIHDSYVKATGGGITFWYRWRQ